MAFHEVSLPDSIAYGASGGPGHSTEITELLSGSEQRVARWEDARRKYQVDFILRNKADLMELQEFVIARRGALHGFRFKDWADYSSSSDGRSTPATSDQQIGVGDGLETDFQLVKAYTSGPATISRSIEKPVSGSVVVEVDGVAKTEGVDYTVNTTTGLVTFTVAPPNSDVVKAGFEFEVPVRFGSGVDELLSISHVAFETGNIPGLELIEIKDPTAEAADDYFPGGGRYLSFAANITLAIGDGRVQVLNPTAASKKVYLPEASGLALGGPYFLIKNDSGSTAFTLNLADDTLVSTFNTGDAREIFLGVNSGGAKTWIVLG